MSKLDKDKALRYIGQLDQARCNGKWHELPKLVKKLQKHAPRRKCLILSAQSEPQVALHASKPSSTSSASLPQLIPPLLTAFEAERDTPQDAFQARICLGEIHFLLEEPALAVSRLPKDFGEVLNDLNKAGSILAGWTQVCAFKGAYLRGVSLAKNGATLEAVETMRSVLPLLTTITSSEATAPQLQIWTERLLTHLCLASIEHPFGATGKNGLDDFKLGSSEHSQESLNRWSEQTLEAFRSWAQFLKSAPGHGLGPSAATGGTLQRRVWKEYYAIVSRVLQSGAPYPAPIQSGSRKGVTLNMQQIAEIKSVETMYEGLLLKEVRFPKAHEHNAEIESWIDMVVKNWNVVCGSGWQDKDLGNGGKEAHARNLLDILYRAATKTFHSTPILRRLFSVHSSLAEFDLAIKALDSYLEIVTRGKARAERSGEPDPGLDSDEMIVKTTAEGINVLCRFGARAEAEKAKDIGDTIIKWLSHFLPDSSQPTTNGNNSMTDSKEYTTTFDLSPKIVALAYRAVGISQAHWARVTYEASSRAEIQRKAILNFRRALSPSLGNTNDVGTLYALGLLLAETRDLNGALEVVKCALEPRSMQSQPITADGVISEKPHITHDSHQGNGFAAEKKLIPVWHLLALLLTARQDFESAARSCEAAFEQFGDPTNLFGPFEPVSPRQNGERGDSCSTSFSGKESERSSEKAPTLPSWNVVDSMEGHEKETVIQVKITQLALIELLEGPELAVNVSDELLSLFARLFKDLEIEIKADNRTGDTTGPPPKSSNGTIGSLRGSLFGRSKSVRKALPGEKTATAPSTQGTLVQSDLAPTISVTDEDGFPSEKHETHHRHHIFHHEGHHHGGKLHKRSGSDGRPKSKGSLTGRRKNDSNRTWTADQNRQSTAQFSTATTEDNVTHSTPETPHPYIPHSRTDNRSSTHTSPSQVGLAVSQDIPAQTTSPPRNAQLPGNSLPPVPHNLPRKQQPAPISHPDQPPQQDVRLPTVALNTSSTQAGPRFSSAQTRRQVIGLLVKVWLVVAGLYRRSVLYEDAKGAIDEAYKLVEGLEIEVAKTDSSSRAFAERGWGGGKSIDHLWGDVWAERGSLSQAQSSPHDALAHFEQALTYFPDHPSATVGVANILLDIYTQTISPTPSSASAPFSYISTTSSSTIHDVPNPNPTEPPRTPSRTPDLTARPSPLGLPESSTSTITRQTSIQDRSSPNMSDEFDRLAARDRAYSLLSSLTKLGTGWDYSEAWFALARAYEEGGQIEKAKEVLWWCVELEEGRAIRAWANVSAGGYVL
ncbi:MAG: hypothetical protein M1836_002323 [Candelina mexicana]|nr:MAG: hypothetical protein M1836_002323 [Candelina mexicana]